MRSQSLVLATGLLVALSTATAQAHSGRTNVSGCHAGSRPYHCHNSGRTSTPPAPARPEPWRVLSVGDGDTLTVVKGSEEMRVRLACIDAPETRQSYGQSARMELQRLLPVGTPVNLRTVNTDRYGRTVAELNSQGRNINLSLVATGHAVVYDQYLSSCENGEAYLAAEEIAQQNQLMFWNSSPVVMPWDFRREQR